MAVTAFLLVVMVLGYGGIVYGSVGYGFLFLAESRHYSAGFIFALAAWAAAASAAIWLLNALFGNRIEPKYTQLGGAIMFAGAGPLGIVLSGPYLVLAARGLVASSPASSLASIVGGGSTPRIARMWVLLNAPRGGR